MADLQELRGRIIQVFFKHLTSSNEVAVDMSQEGLAAVITYQKMPKTLLQVQSTQQKPVLDNQLSILKDLSSSHLASACSTECLSRPHGYV